MPGTEQGSTPRATVAVTREIGRNRPLIEQLEARGLGVVEVSLIEVVEPDDGGAALRAVAESLAEYRWVVLTSVNGVEALDRALAEVGRSWPSETGLPTEVAAVGPATAAAATACGMPVRLVGPAATAESLVAAFPPAPRSAARHRPVLAPLAALAGSTIEDGLAAKGWPVVRVQAYQTRAPLTDDVAALDSSGLGHGPIDLVAFFSPSAVDRWVDRFGSASTAVCIGPATAARAKARGLSSIVMAEPHSEAGVLRAIEELVGPDPDRAW